MADTQNAASRQLTQNYPAQRAAILASMARAHDKMLREIYYQKLQRGQVRKLQMRNEQLELELEAQQSKAQRRPINDSHAAQRAGILASMARAHDKMLRDIYYQKLQRGHVRKLQVQNEQLKLEVQNLKSNRRPISDSHAAQRAGILASMARAHDKMLRDIYYQKLQRGRNKRAEEELSKLRTELQSARAALPSSDVPDEAKTGLEQELRILREENETLQRMYDQSKKLAEAGLEHRGVTEEVIEENHRLQGRVHELERQLESCAAAGADEQGELQLLRSKTKRLEIENMKLERQVHDLAGGGTSSPVVHVPSLPIGRQSPPIEDRFHDLEHRVRELEVRTSPRGHEPSGLVGSPRMHEPAALADHSPTSVPPPSQARTPFTARVACDVHGVKHNIRLFFYQQPTMAALVNAVDTCYDVTARASHPRGCPDVPFTLAALQIFDSVQQRWVDLNEHLLSNVHDPQLFCFQHASVWHPDRPGTIPVAENIDTWLTLPSGPKRSIAITAPPPRSVMVVAVFKELVGPSDGFFQYADMRNALLRFGLELSGKTVGELFADVDKRRDNVVTRDEWVDYCKEHPHFVEVLYFKSLDAKHEPSGVVPQPSPGHYLSPSQQERLASRMEAEADVRPGFRAYSH